MDESLLIAGVDEVGRGPLAGPVVAAAVILDPGCLIEGIKDSKALSEKRREVLCAQIQAGALAWAVGRAEVEEIDELNIHHASLLAMQRAVEALNLVPHKALVDGKFAPKLACATETIIKGDSIVEVIGAASIVAKVIRDREMIAFDAQYPGYGFAKHKGYGTKQHLEALHQLGPLSIHRTSFAPVAKLL